LQTDQPSGKLRDALAVMAGYRRHVRDGEARQTEIKALEGRSKRALRM
jgi:hypothetical protein